MTALLTRPQAPPTPSRSPMPPAPPPPVEKPPRLVSLDAYRGFIMLAMASSAFALSGVVRNLFPAGQPPLVNEAWRPFWQLVGYNANHVEWGGCAFWDLIQPSFMFMVGVAIPYSYASRKARGDSDARIAVHTIWRSLLLVLLGVFLTSASSKQTNWIFPNVLCQIGLGYTFVYLLHRRGLGVQLAGLVAILAGSWALFYFWPLPGEGFDYTAVGLANWQHWQPGFFAHWDKNTNAGWAFDRELLNWFPRETPFKFNDGGYTTLNFLPSMATMVLGLMAGELLRGPQTRGIKFGILVAAGAVCLALGITAGLTVCPVVKRIWTPSWALYSSGWTFFMLAGFYLVIDIWGWKAWAFPFVVVGMNSIAMYVMAQLLPSWIANTLQIHLGGLATWLTTDLGPRLLGFTLQPWYGPGLFEGVVGPVVRHALVLFVLWLVCWWMYRRGIFLRI